VTLPILGKLPAAGHLDKHPVKLGAVLPLSPDLFIPPECDWTLPFGAPLTFDALANLVIGDCVIATGLDSIRCAAAWTGTAPDFTAADATAEYTRLAGYDPNDPTTDRGMLLFDMLRAQEGAGLAGHKSLGFAAVDPHDWDHVCTAIAYFGSLACGVMLPESAKSQVDLDFRLDTPRTGSDVAGSWGGHAFAALGYRRDEMPGDIGPSLLIATWGGTKWVSRAWWEAYADECAAPLLEDWLRAGITPGGLPLAELRWRLSQIGRVDAGVGV
jgi:hypothetical protein